MRGLIFIDKWLQKWVIFYKEAIPKIGDFKKKLKN